MGLRGPNVLYAGILYVSYLLLTTVGAVLLAVELLCMQSV